MYTHTLIQYGREERGRGRGKGRKGRKKKKSKSQYPPFMYKPETRHKVHNKEFKKFPVSIHAH